MRISLSTLLAKRAVLAPEREALVGGGRRLTWQEADAECTRLARWFLAQGVLPGDRVAVLAKNSIEMMLSLFALSRADAIGVVLNWRLSAGEIAWIVQDCGARAIVHDAAFAPLLAGLDMPNRLSIGACVGVPSYQDALAAPPAHDDPDPRRGGDDVAVILYTSGTTGTPKGAMLTHANFVWSAYGVTCVIDWFERHRFLMVAPMFHIGGLMPAVTSVQKGNALVFMADFDAAAVWRTIAAERITTGMFVPVMLQALEQAADAMPVDTSSVEYLICGASAVPAAMIESWERRGVAVQQGYGLTEITGAATFWTPAMGKAGIGSQGRPIFYTEVRVVDPHTRAVVDDGRTGEVMTRGPTVFAGYWNNEAASRAAFRDGWFATGDLGHIDDLGFLRVVDRLKDLIISGGENIYPAEVERVLAEHSSVAEVAVIGHADEKWGQVPVAYVVVRTNQPCDATSLTTLCRQRLGGYKRPHRFIFIDALPRNGAGKVLKRDLASFATAWVKE